MLSMYKQKRARNHGLFLPGRRFCNLHPEHSTSVAPGRRRAGLGGIVMRSRMLLRPPRRRWRLHLPCARAASFCPHISAAPRPPSAAAASGRTPCRRSQARKMKDKSGATRGGSALADPLSAETEADGASSRSTWATPTSPSPGGRGAK